MNPMLKNKKYINKLKEKYIKKFKFWVCMWNTSKLCTYLVKNNESLIKKVWQDLKIGLSCTRKSANHDHREKQGEKLQIIQCAKCVHKYRHAWNTQEKDIFLYSFSKEMSVFVHIFGIMKSLLSQKHVWLIVTWLQCLTFTVQKQYTRVWTLQGVFKLICWWTNSKHELVLMSNKHFT